MGSVERHKWLDVKHNRSVLRYKARPAAKRFSQTYKIDYQVTFDPVAKINYIHVRLSIATNWIGHFNNLTQRMPSTESRG